MQFGKNEKAPKVCFVLNEILFVIGFITIANVYFFSKVLSFFLNSTFQNTNVLWQLSIVTTLCKSTSFRIPFKSQNVSVASHSVPTFLALSS